MLPDPRELRNVKAIRKATDGFRITIYNQGRVLTSHKYCEMVCTRHSDSYQVDFTLVGDLSL